MSIFSLIRRPRQNTQVAVFEIQGTSVAFPMAAVVGRVAWSGGGKRVCSESLATGYTSHGGRLVPVFDLSGSLGLPERSIGSDDVAIVETSQGYAAIQIDRFVGSSFASEETKLLSPDDVLSLTTRVSGNA